MATPVCCVRRWSRTRPCNHLCPATPYSVRSTLSNYSYSITEGSTDHMVACSVSSSTNRYILFYCALARVHATLLCIVMHNYQWTTRTIAGAVVLPLACQSGLISRVCRAPQHDYAHSWAQRRS